MTRVLFDAADIGRAVTRLAHEIVESAPRSDRRVLLGIPRRGVVLAERLAATIEHLTGARPETGVLDVSAYRDDARMRSDPARERLPTRIPEAGIDGVTVVLVDDVLFTGRTVRAAFDALADLGRPQCVQLAVLVDRGHRDYPIRADFVGKNVPSHVTERVRVRVYEADGEDAVLMEAFS